MVRIVKEEQYTARRNEILTAAQRLVQTKGYRQMTIQDILEDLQISKGAFYHYFRSKHALLEGIIERMQADVEQLLTPIVQDPHLSAIEKLQRLFATLASWKTARKDFVLALLAVWYRDDNALVRQKAFTTSVEKVAPMLKEIIHQGIQEGALKTSYPPSKNYNACLPRSPAGRLPGRILFWLSWPSGTGTTMPLSARKPSPPRSRRWLQC